MSLLPYDCGVTMPDWQRYTYPKFLRLTRHFRSFYLNEEDALELAGFLRVLPVQWARWAFHWDDSLAKQGQKVLNERHDQAEGRYIANLEAMTPEAGVAMLHAMRRGGWPEHGLPPIVKAGFFACRDRGMSIAQIAEMFEVKHHQVEWPFRQPSRHSPVLRMLHAPDTHGMLSSIKKRVH